MTAMLNGEAIAPEDGKTIVVETTEEADLTAKMLVAIAAIWR